jgi:GNAT superfamily N-acetyltransferase
VPAIVGLFDDDDLSSAAYTSSGAPPGERPSHVVPSDAHYAAFEAIQSDPNNQVFVAEMGGVVVGTFQLTFIRQLSYGGCLVAQVESVHVHSSARSHGVGRTMMEFARAEAVRRGAYRVQLTSNLKRERAHSFYERLGYRATHKGMKLQLEPSAPRGKIET